MVILIAGASHTGKTLLAQKLLEKYSFPYFSLDHLKMGLIRSKQTKLSVEDDEELTTYLWSIVKEIIKTAIENNQNLIIEGCYIPFNWKKSFTLKYLKEIKFVCLVMSKRYIETHIDNIIKFENAIEKRLRGNSLIKENLIKENIKNLQLCKKHKLNYILIDKNYNFEIDI